MALSSNTLNSFHNVFDQAIGQGFSNIQSDVNWIFNFLCILTIALTAVLTWAWEDASSVIRSLIQKMLMIGFVGLVLNNWHQYSLMIVNGFTSLGLKASGSTMSSQTFLNEPSQIFVDGLKLFTKIHDSCGCTFLGDPIATIIYYLCGCLVVFAFGWLALGVFVATLEFKIVTLAGMIFIPFAIWPKLSFLSERALGYVFSFGAKMLTLALIVSLGEQSIADLNIPAFAAGATSGKYDAIFTVCGLSLALTFIAVSSSRLAAALVSGGPQLGAGSAAAFGAGMAGAAVGAAALAGGVVSTATSSVLGRFRAASAASTMARTANAAGGNANPLAAAATAALFPSRVGRNGPSNGSAPKTPPGGAGGGSVDGGGIAPKPAPSGGGDEIARPPSGSDDDKSSSANDGGSASATPVADETAQNTQAQSPDQERADAATTPKSQTATGDAATAGSKAGDNPSSPSTGEPKAQSRSYTTGGRERSPLKKITDELRALEGQEATGSLGGPDIHK